MQPLHSTVVNPDVLRGISRYLLLTGLGWCAVGIVLVLAHAGYEPVASHFPQWFTEQHYNNGRGRGWSWAGMAFAVSFLTAGYFMVVAIDHKEPPRQRSE